MSLTPITRNDLKQLKINADEEKRKAQERLKAAAFEMCRDIRRYITEYAKGSSFTKYAIAVNLPSASKDSCYNMKEMDKGDISLLFEHDPSNILLNWSEKIPLLHMDDDMMPIVCDAMIRLFPDSTVSVKSMRPWGEIVNGPTALNKHTPTFLVIDWS